MNTNGDLKSRIKVLLLKHKGRHSAIRRRHILSELGLPEKADRKLRLTISELRREGFPVLFETTHPAGYYLPANLTELNQGMDKLKSYIIDECIILRDLKVYGRMFVAGEKQGVLL